MTPYSCFIIKNLNKMKMTVWSEDMTCWRIKNFLKIYEMTIIRKGIKKILKN